MIAPLICVSPAAVVNESVIKLKSGLSLPILPPNTVVPLS